MCSACPKGQGTVFGQATMCSKCLDIFNSENPTDRAYWHFVSHQICDSSVLPKNDEIIEKKIEKKVVIVDSDPLLPIEAIIGIAVGAAFLLVCCIVIWFITCRESAGKQRTPKRTYIDQELSQSQQIRSGTYISGQGGNETTTQIIQGQGDGPTTHVHDVQLGNVGENTQERGGIQSDQKDIENEQQVPLSKRDALQKEHD